MKEEAQILIDRVRIAFRDVKGPPRITLSVARGVDDHRYSELGKLAKTQAHHTHWTLVTNEELIEFRDCWAFLDAVSMQFYLPAFVSHYIEIILEESERHLVEPDWWPHECITIGPEKLTSFTQEQLQVITDFLMFIEGELVGDSRERIRPTRQAWCRNLKHLTRR